MYNKIQPYHLNNELRERGWKSTEEGVFIPWPFSKEDDQLYLKIQKIGKNYKYSCFSKNKNKIIRNVTRNATIIDDINGDGQRVDTNPMGGENQLLPEPFTQSIKYLMRSGEKVSEDYINEFILQTIYNIKKTDCLTILLDYHYYNKEYEQFKKNEYALIKQFQIREHVGKARQRLASWLKTRFDVILRKNSHDIYILDEKNNSYTEVTMDELLYKVSEILGPQLINDDDLKWALSYISDRLDPQHNIVKFSDLVFDMEKLEPIDTEDPVFTLVETPYRYMPCARSTVLKEFLYSSLQKSTPEETEETVQGVKEVVGYLFTSGNPLNLLPMITGISGGGKSVFANILIAIFGKDKIADLKLQEIEKNTHATSSLANKHLNIIQDSDDSAINNNSLIKQITGNDPLQVNPKHVNPFVLPKEEVPKTILICNTLPRFKRLEQALLERFLIIEFNVKFRGTDDENPNLLNEILEDPREIEWFIFESIQAYKKMVESGKDFILRKDGDATRALVDKHQNPLNYLLCQLIDEHNPDESNELGYLYTNELNAAIRHLAEVEGIDLILNRKGLLSSKRLIEAIRYEFDLYDPYYQTRTHDGARYYPDLVPNMKYWDIVDELFDEFEIPDKIKKEKAKAKENLEESKEGETDQQNG